MKSAIFCNFGADNSDLNAVFSPHLKARIKAQTLLFPHVVTQDNFTSFSTPLREVEVIFATWGMWELSAEQLAAMPKLKAVFYAAGSVKGFARVLLERGIIVTSSWQANAIPVAEFTLAQILLANKGYFTNVSAYRESDSYDGLFRGQGNYGARISILGAGQIGRRVIELLRPFNLRVSVFDPYLSNKAAELLGVEKIESLAAAFETGDVVSNHLADLPPTYGMLRGHHFALMPQNATFINTGRGRTANHDELMVVLQGRPDLTALLDVTEPEPLPRAHPLRALPNVYISGHIAGSIGGEVARMAQMAIEEFNRFECGEPLRYKVSLEMLETMA